MRSNIQIGRTGTGRRLVAHLSIDGRTCAQTRPVRTKLGAISATTRLCKLCFTEARRTQVADRLATVWDARISALMAEIADALGPAQTLDPAGFNPEYDVERAEIAAAHAEAAAPVESAPVRELSRLGQVAASLAGATDPKAAHTVTPISARRRRALSRSFATNMKAA